MTAEPLSPYAAALGDEFGALHKQLQTYFQTIPAGRAGVGHGVFDEIGCRRPMVRALLAPLLHHLQRREAVFAGWAEQVPFTVRNRDGVRRSAERTLHLAGGPWTMRDRVQTLPGGRVADRVGRSGPLVAVFAVAVHDGALELHSTRVGLRLGRMRLRIPSWIAPRIRLRESADEAHGRQWIDLTVDLPLLGRIHEYSGTFRYGIEEEP